MKRLNKLYESKAILSAIDRALVQVDRLELNRKDRESLEKVFSLIKDAKCLAVEILETEIKKVSDYYE